MYIQRFLGVVLSAVAFVVCYAESVKGQTDQCRDILTNGTMKYSRLKDNNYVKQIIYSRFMSSTYEQAKNDKKGGFDVPVGEIILGANFSEEQFNEKKASLERENFQSIDASRELDVAVTSGDAEIVSAWTDCMNKKGGISLQLNVASPTEIFAILEWSKKDRFSQTTLEEDITLPPGASISSGAACFESGRVLVMDRPCRVSIKLPDALTTLAFAVNTTEGSTSAYLPKRIKFAREVKNYDFGEGDNLYTSAYKTSKTPTRELKLSNEQIADGWTFNVGSAGITLVKHRLIKADGNSCESEYKKAELYTFTYGFQIKGNSNGRSTAVCEVIPSIMLVRGRWIPMN